MACGLDEARTLISQQSFHVALVDYRLAEGYGDAVVKLINARQKECATIMLSGHPMSEVSLYGLNAGATAAISKDDLNPELLETTIRFAMANAKRNQAT